MIVSLEKSTFPSTFLLDSFVIAVTYIGQGIAINELIAISRGEILSTGVGRAEVVGHLDFKI